MLVVEPLLPAAPIANMIDPVREHWVMIIMGAAAMLSLIRALFDWRSSGRPIALMMFIAGGFAALHEPLVDLLGGCWHYANARTAFVAYGRPIPLWLCVAYFSYVGVGLSLVSQTLRRGLTPRQVWLLYGGIMLGDCIMEITLLNLDIYAYYGSQPFVVARFPLWWAPVNAGYIMATAAVVYRLDTWLQGWRTAAIIPITLGVSAAFNAAAGWPAWFVINSNLGLVTTQLGGLLTVGLSFYLVSFVVKTVAANQSDADASIISAAVR